MSVLEAVAPLRRRALERQGLTPETEMQLLIQEQEADDVFFVRHEANRPETFMSFDGFVSGSRDLVSDFIAEVDGEVVSYLPRSMNESLFCVSFRHSTFDAYNNKGCRCRQCKSFMAEYRRQKRAA